MQPLPALRALHITPATGQTEVVVWDQSLGQLFDWIGESYYWTGDRYNKVYHVQANDGPRSGQVQYPRWLRPLHGSLLIVSTDPTTGEDASLSLRDIDDYRRHLTMSF